MPAVRRPGIGFVLAVLLSMFLALAAQAQTDSGSSSSTVPTLTIVSSSATATEGDEVTYTVTASSAPSSALPVVVQVRAHGEVMDTRTVAEVFLPAGATTVTLRLEEFTDEIDESPVNVTLTLAAGTGYSVGDPAEATVSIDYPSISDTQATPTPTPTPAVSPPDAPSGVSVSSPSRTSFTVSWTAEAGKTYRLEREAAYLFKYRVWQMVADNVTGGSFTESGLPCDLYYVYRVQAKVAGSAFGAGTRVLGPAQACQSSPSSGARGVRAVGTPMPQLRIVTDNPEQDSIQIRLLLYGSPDEVYNPIRNMDMFQVDRSERYAGSGDPVFPSPAIRREERVAEFDWGGLECGSSYYFRARGHGNGESDGFTDEWGKWSHEHPREAQGTVHGSTRGCTLSPPPAPGNVRASVDLPNAQVTVSWNAVTGVDPSNSYKLERSDDGGTTWPTSTFYVKTGITATSETVQLAGLGLTCGQSYTNSSFRVRARGNGTDFLADYGDAMLAEFDNLTNSSRSTARGPTQRPLCIPAITMLPAPDVSVIPLPRRRVLLRWDRIGLATDGYNVRIRKKGVGATWPSSAPNYRHIGQPSADDPSLEIMLDQIVQTIVGSTTPDEGLAHHSAYEFQIEAVDMANPSNNNTSEVTLVVGPNVTVNGDSTGETLGKMVIRWVPITNATNYTIRWRVLPNMHGTSGWQVNNSVESDWESHDFTSPSSVNARNGLNLHEYTLDGAVHGPFLHQRIYAVQLNYSIDSQEYFSAREAYVWISDRKPLLNENVATFPFIGHFENYTYAYRICKDKFPGDIDQWALLIEDALERWEIATNGFIVMTPQRIGPGTSTSPQYEACTNYSRDGTVPSDVSVTALVDTDWFKTIVAKDNMWNEIRAVRFPSLGDATAASFHEVYLAADPFKGCMLTLEPPFACVSSSPPFGETLSTISANGLKGYLITAYHKLVYENVSPPTATTSLNSADIIFNKSVIEAATTLPNRPATIAYYACVNGTTPVLSDGAHFQAYTGAVHEAGHALGLAGRPYSGSSFSDFAALIKLPYEVAHPTSRGTVMNYNSKAGVSEPDCFPQPLDVMAIFALYQTPVPISP